MDGGMDGGMDGYLAMPDTWALPMRLGHAFVTAVLEIYVPPGIVDQTLNSNTRPRAESSTSHWERYRAEPGPVKYGRIRDDTAWDPPLPRFFA